MQNNPNLYCVDVDNDGWSFVNWTPNPGFEFDPQHYFSNNCSGTGIEENSTKKELFRKIDVK